MRGADVLISFPALLFILVLVTGAGTSKAVLVATVAVVQMPLIARIIRTATLEQSVRGFVEAAVARGERTFAILRREILPNIVSPIMADVGLRFTFSIILVASVNFLGLGLQPPAADWALMICENRDGLNLNPFVILVPAALIALLTIVGEPRRRRGRADARPVRGEGRPRERPAGPGACGAGPPGRADRRGRGRRGRVARGLGRGDPRARRRVGERQDDDRAGAARLRAAGRSASSGGSVEVVGRAR